MSKEKMLENLGDEEIIKLYELFYGPVLARKEISFYQETLLSLIDKEGAIDKVLDRLNLIELEIIKLLSMSTKSSIRYLNEKLSLILGEHPSFIGKMIQNLISKNYLVLRNETEIIVPSIISNKFTATAVDFSRTQSDCSTYHNPNAFHTISIINYFISKGIKFSKNGGLYKKDYETISAMFNTSTGFLRDEYDIIAYFFSTGYIYDEHLQKKKIKEFFELTILDKMLLIVKRVFPYIYPIVKRCSIYQRCYSVPLLEMKELYKTLLISTELAQEPYRTDFDNMFSFLTKIGICSCENDIITFNYYKESTTSQMDMKITSNYSVYVNTENTDSDYYLCAIFGQLIKYDKIAEFEINDNSIRHAVSNGYTLEDFKKFIELHSIELGGNITTTINEWFEKHSSFFYVEGTVFIAETLEKGKLISKLIETEMVRIYPIKANSIFIVPPEEKEEFFAFLSKSNFTFCEKKPIKKLPPQPPMAQADNSLLFTFE